MVNLKIQERKKEARSSINCMFLGSMMICEISYPTIILYCPSCYVIMMLIP